MEDADSDPRLAQLTAEMAWLRRLAKALLRNDDAEDLAHDAWLVAAEHRPNDGRPLRPWLHRVALNLVRMQARARMRRVAREANSATPDVRGANPEELIQRVELQRVLVSEVLRLDEPYRSTVLLHFFEELSCAEIARRFELPEGTVRRRLKVGLDELRKRLVETDKKAGDAAVLAPLASLAAESNPWVPWTAGAIAMKKLIAALALLLLLIIAGVVWNARRGGRAENPTRSASEIALADRSRSAAAPTDGDAQIPGWLAQLEVKPKRIAGRVMFRGAPVPGATVELASLATESGLAPPRRTTNAAGEFDFGPQGAMEWSVRASAPGKASTSIDIDLRSPAASPEHLVLELGACDAAMIGTIRDASGGPIAKARVARLPTGKPVSVPGGPAVLSDDKGRYEMCVEARWPYDVAVEVSAESYRAITYDTIVAGRVTVDFALVPEAVIAGRVVRDDTGAPVPQAYVFVPGGPRGTESTPLRGAMTDSSGRFRIGGVAAGRHLVFARAAGLVDTTRGTPVVVGVGQSSVEIEIRVEAGSTIRGKVVDHGKPVAGARVAALNDFQARLTAVSQEDGSFVLAGVPLGEIRFAALPYEILSPRTFRVTGPSHDVTLEVESRGTIVGHVVRNKQPLPFANVDIHGPNDYELDEIRADANGRFEARGLRPGPWVLFAWDDHQGAFGRAPETINLARGQTAEVTIDVAFAGAISGRVVDQHGAPVPGVTVAFRNTKSEDVGIAATADDGSFRAATMTGGGQYRPVVARNLLSSAQLRPASGSDFPLITLDNGDSEVTGVLLAVKLDQLSIAGKVVDSTGMAVPDARVIAVLVDGTGATAVPHGVQDPAATSDVDGQFSINELFAGTYALRARSPAGTEATLPGVTAGRSDAVIVLPSPGGIDVTTFGFKTPPQVSAAESGTRDAPTLGTPQGNVYAIRNLSPGTYTVTATTTNESASAVVQVTAGSTTSTTLTSSGSGVVAGRVIDFRSGRPVEGMTCRALPRVGMQLAPVAPSDGTRTDAQGGFLIDGAPAGPIAVWCDGLWRTYSDGMRLVTLAPSQRSDIDVPVVAWSEEPGTTLGGPGFELDRTVLVPQIVNVQPKGSAALAGFQQGDIIVSLDGASVSELSTRGVWVLLINRPPGSKVKIGAMRAGKPFNGEIVLGEAPP